MTECANDTQIAWQKGSDLIAMRIDPGHCTPSSLTPARGATGRHDLLHNEHIKCLLKVIHLLLKGSLAHVVLSVQVDSSTTLALESLRERIWSVHHEQPRNAFDIDAQYPG